MIMKKRFEKVLSLLKNDYLLNDFVTYKIKNNTLKVFYNDKVITISTMGFAYLISWYADGFITSGQSDNLNNICRGVNND